MEKTIEKCPACGNGIRIDSIDPNWGDEDGYGDLNVPFECPHCKAELNAVYDAQDGYGFKYIETA